MRKAILPAVLLSLVCFPVFAQENLVQNPSFEDGDGGPDLWTLSAEPGRWETAGHTGERCVSIQGAEPGQSSTWSQSGIPVEPFSTYRFSFFAKVDPGTAGGCIVSGPDFCNRDLNVGEDWTRSSHVFITRRDQTSAAVRVGHWEKVGRAYFDDIAVTPVLPVHRRTGDLTLGDGERIADGVYTFSAPLGAEGANYSRPLQDFNTGFNSMRWVFGPGAFVTYRHELPATPLTSAKVSVNIGWYASGHCLVEASSDGERFIQIGRMEAKEGKTFDVPAELLPAKVLYVRFRSPGEVEAREDSHPGSFQIHGYDLEAELGARLADAAGATRYLDVSKASPQIVVAIDDLGEQMPGADNIARLRLRNTGNEAAQVTVALSVLRRAPDGEAPADTRTVTVQLPPGAEVPVAAPYDVDDAGDFTLALSVTGAGDELFAAQTEFTVPSLYAASYGYPVRSDALCDVWWCEGTYKVSKERPAVVAQDAGTRPVRMTAARNEFEPCQIVLKPKSDLKGLTATASDLTGPGGAKLSADNLDLCYVWYHYVKRTTDYSGCVGWWPDALPPLAEPIDIAANENQPLWITVEVPKGTPAGEYQGTIALKAEGWSLDVPVELRVWNFTLPDEGTVATAFGLDEGAVAQYHNLTTNEEREQVFDLYMQNFRDHRISPYSFWRKGIQVKFTGISWQGGEVVEEDPFEGKRCLKIVDESDTSTSQANAQGTIPVDPAARYMFSFAAKTAEPGQQFLITFQSHDASGQWISGHNLDVAFTGTGKWESIDYDFVPGEKSPDARSLSLVLRPALWAEGGTTTGTAWFDDLSLVKEGADANLLGDPGFEMNVAGVKAEVDFTGWDEYAEKYLDEYHFNAFRLPLSGMGGGTFHSRYSGKIGPYEQGTDEYRSVFKDYCTQIQDHLAEKGWLDKAYIYWFDEPTPDDYDFVREGMGEIKRAGPKLRRMLTEEPVEALEDSVDIWCPVLENYDAEKCQAQQEKGKTIWWYVCTGPKAPYPGLFIDHNAVELRMWQWMTWKWNVQGALVWTSNWWTSSCAFPDPNEPQNPWEDPMGYVAGYGLPAGYVGYWGNGDGRFIYPPNMDIRNDRGKYITGPVNSIRWEMLREGLEDYEYFHALRQLIDKSGDRRDEGLLEISEAVIKNKTEFTRDPRPMHEHREKLARAIERLAGE